MGHALPALQGLDALGIQPRGDGIHAVPGGKFAEDTLTHDGLPGMSTPPPVATTTTRREP